MGTPDFAVPSLRAITNIKPKTYNLTPIAVVTQPDRPVGRKQTLTPPPVKRVAEELGIPVLQPVKLRNPETVEAIKSLKPDLIVVVAYGQIIPKTILTIPRFGTLNVHGSLLPTYRGASPLIAAIAAGERETGVTIMLMDELLDHGPILARSRIPIDPHETGGSLSQKLSTLGAQLLAATIPQWISGAMKPQEQDPGMATMTKLLNREDGKINWHEFAETIERKIRAYNPWPGAWTVWKRGLEMLRLGIHRTRIATPVTRSASEAISYSPGTAIATEQGFAVQCENGALEILEIQPQGKRIMNAAEFLHGYPDVIGSQWV